MALGIGNDCLQPYYISCDPDDKASPFHNRYLRVRCNHCLNCKRAKASEWQMRNDMEAYYWDDICFATFTYAPEYVPINLVETKCFEGAPAIWKPKDFDSNAEMQKILTLDREEVKLYFKRLRKHLDYSVRYYCTGEYGEAHDRPHLHALIFGLKPEDWSKAETAWQGKGIVKLLPLKDGGTAYVSGYVQKKLYGDLKNPSKQPEFLNASQHIGERWLMDHLNEFDDDHPYINFKGFKRALPRTFHRKLVSLGILTKKSLCALYWIQQREYKELCEHVKNQGISLEQYFHGRQLEAKAKARKARASRLKNKEF